METELEKINRLKNKNLSISNTDNSNLPFNPNERQGGLISGFRDTMDGLLQGISNLPQGIENVMGNIYEGGADLLLGKKYPAPTLNTQTQTSPTVNSINKNTGGYSAQPQVGTFGDNGQYTYNVDSMGNPYGAPINSTQGIGQGLGIGQAPMLDNMYSEEESTFMDEYYNSLLEGSTNEYDPERTLQEANRLFQDQIDAQTAYYNDLIEESRMRNQPEYQKNLDMLRLQQLAGGYGTSGAARAETQKQQQENQRVQNAQESVLRAEMQDKINAIQGNITNYAQKAKENFDKLKAESTEKYLQALRDRPTQRKAIIGQVVDNLLNMGIDIEDLSEEQIAEYAKQLSNSATGNITSDNIRSEYKSLKSQYESAQKEAELEERKTLAGIKKTEAETGQIGKVSPTTSAQIAWEREKAKMGGDDEEKPLTAEQIKQAIRPMLTTPEFKAMSKKEKRDYIYSQGGEPSDYGI